MKKFAKMSLAAVVAIAGLTSTASAGSLEEAIKGVDISGKVRYRIEDKSGAAHQDQDVNIDLNVKVPVTDTVTFVAHGNLDNDDQGNNNSLAGAGDFNLENYYFQYASGPVTALLGTQEIPGRLTDGLAGEGLVALYDTGAGFTVGAAAFYNHEVSAEETYSLIAMGAVGPVELLAQYLTVSDVVDVYNIKADAGFGPAKVGVEYTAKEWDSAVMTPNDDYSTLKAYISGKVDIVSAKLGYVKTGDNGSGSADEAVETASEFLVWQMYSGGKAEMDAFVLDASVAVTDKISIRAAYADGEYSAADTEITETLGQISYKVAKNLSTYVRYSNYESEGSDDVERGRIEVKYSF